MYQINVSKAARTIEVDFNALPEVSQRFVIEYGLRQLLNDATAPVSKKNSKDVSGDALALAEKRLAKIISGDFSRATKSTVGGLEALVAKVAREFARKLAPVKVKGWAAMSKDQKADVLETLATHEKVLEKARPIAEEQYKMQQAADGIDIEL